MDVRVSVANLAWFLEEQGKGQSFQFGIPNPKKLKDGVLQIQALGGGAELTEMGMNHFTQEYGARKFEKDERTGNYDARFVVDDSMLESVFAVFSKLAANPTNSYEMDPTSDILTELSGKEFPDKCPILTPEEAQRIGVKYLRTARQKPSSDSMGTSMRGLSAGMPTRRMFRLYKLIAPSDLFEKLQDCSLIHFLSWEELLTTDGGSCKGKTKDGHAIADNLFLA